MAIDNPLALYEFGVAALKEGKSPGELQLELGFDPYMDRRLIEAVVPLLDVLYQDKRYRKMRYLDWLKDLVNNPRTAGIPGVIMTLSAIVLGFAGAYQVGIFLDIEDSSIILAGLVAFLCVPILGVLGVPLFFATRRYWEWRAWRVRHIHGPMLSSRPVEVSSSFSSSAGSAGP